MGLGHFEKAFDRVDHDLLLAKLWSYGFSRNLIDFFASYLSDRRQQVSYFGSTSSPYLATSGVPQGGVLGPVLFLFFINDITNVLQHSKCLLYADDLKIFRLITALVHCTLLQQDLVRLIEWSLENKLFFNFRKCKSLNFSRKKTPITYQYQMNGNSLENVTSFKDLGLLLDQGLVFDKHINSIVQSSYQLLGFLKRNTKHFSYNTIAFLFNSYVRPKLEYASVVWSQSTADSRRSIDSVQHRFLRYLSFKKHKIFPPITTRTSEFLFEFNITRLSDRRQIAQIIFIQKLVSGLIDCPKLLELLNFNVPMLRFRNGTTRPPFFIQVARTFHHWHSPIFSALASWNEKSSSLDLDFNLPSRKLKKIMLKFFHDSYKEAISFADPS